MSTQPPASACCEGSLPCVFAKALLARAATCELSRRTCLAERELLECGSAVARINCATLAGLLHERSRFALRLPAPGRPLMHVHALRLQCGGLSALQQWLATESTDVHGMVQQAQHQRGSLADLPWDQLVPVLAAWQPPRRRRPPQEEQRD